MNLFKIIKESIRRETEESRKKKEVWNGYSMKTKLFHTGGLLIVCGIANFIIMSLILPTWFLFNGGLTLFGGTELLFSAISSVACFFMIGSGFFLRSKFREETKG